MLEQGKEFDVECVSSGQHTKKVYKLTPKNNPDKTNILKLSIKDNNSTDKIKEDRTLRADSPYTNAMIDFYLRENQCKNAADILFYDDNSESVLYDVTAGKLLSYEKAKSFNIYEFNKSKRLRDVADLGVIINDIYFTNIILTKNNTVKLIDTGHATYSSLFRPMIHRYNIALANLCGRELK